MSGKKYLYGLTHIHARLCIYIYTCICISFIHVTMASWLHRNGNVILTKIEPKVVKNQKKRKLCHWTKLSFLQIPVPPFQWNSNCRHQTTNNDLPIWLIMVFNITLALETPLHNMRSLGCLFTGCEPSNCREISRNRVGHFDWLVYVIFIWQYHQLPEQSLTHPGPRLNIKTVLSTYGDFHVKDKTAVRTSYL